MLKKIKYLVVPALMFSPAVVFAQQLFESAGSTNGIDRLLNQVDGLIVRLIPTLVSLAVLLFLWGVLKYVFAKSDPDKKDARNFMIWGIVGLFVMVSIWGLVRILGDVVFGSGKATGPGTFPWPANR